MKKRLLKCGALTLAMCLVFTAGVFASNVLVPVTAYLNYGITVEYNDVDQYMTDANGNQVIPITYNDTTYLPVRAVSNMLNLPVNWDQTTQTVLLGNSYPDVVQPVTPPTPVIPETPIVPVTPSNSTVPTTINAPRLDIGFIFDIINTLAPNKFEVNDYAIRYNQIDGTVMLGNEYAASATDIAYSFHGVEFETISNDPEPVMDTIEAKIGEALTSNGYKFLATDEHGGKHYSNGNIEFVVWDILGNNESLSISVSTRWLSCLGFDD